MILLTLGEPLDLSRWRSVPEELTIVDVECQPAGHTVICRMFSSGAEVGRATNSWEVSAPVDVARWLLSVIGPRHESQASRTATVLYPERDPALTSALVSLLDLDVALVFDEPSYDGTILRLENRARACFVTSIGALSEWARVHIVPASLLDVEDAAAIVATLDVSGEGMGPQPESLPVESVTGRSTRILLVSYFAAPATPVSTIRLGYWRDRLPEIAASEQHPVEVTWLSATRLASSRPGHLVVLDPGDEATVESRTLAGFQRVGLSTIGVSWGERVRSEAVRWGDRFDTVIVSVGPFGYLDLAGFFRDLWDARTIIDFRDPFGGDARMNYSVDQREWINRFERDAVRSADAVVAVNQRCIDTIARGVTVERAIVANGFDERHFRAAERPDVRTGPIELVYSGTIFRTLPIDLLLDALDPARMRLTHYGRDQTEHQTVGHHPAARRGGFIADPSVLASRLATADLGIVRTSGEATTQTTKIFDYLGAGLEILIVTDGEVETGSLAELTAGLDGVYWCRNDRDELRRFFSSYEPRRPIRPQRSAFSREHWARRLLAVALGTAPELDSVRNRPDVVEPTSSTDQTLAAVRYELAGLQAELQTIQVELRRVARGHASNARSIRSHATRIERLEGRVETLRLDRQLRAIPTSGRRRLARRFGRQSTVPGAASPPPPVPTSKPADGPPTILVIANSYPTSAREYGGQHIARRVPHYVRSGYRVVVFVPSETNDRRDVVDALGARVIVGPIESLTQRIAALRPVSLAVHSPLPSTWAAVEPYTRDIATFVWIHGFEARDWRSLAFDYSADEIERDGPRLDALNVERQRVLFDVFTDDAVNTIFVSSFMRSVAEEFVGVPARHGHVIHNVIDPAVFRYHEKTVADRLRVVSVRSFSRRNYGTDLMSLALQRLRRERWFDDLQVTVVGDGRYFECDTGPIAALPQVELHRRLLSADELDLLFARAGISLCPTRWDSQGMVMGESMASGLVPVTNATAAIPEFVDETCAGLAGPDDDVGLAAAIVEMIEDPSLFVARSAAAHARVVDQCGPGRTVRRELDLFDRSLL